VLPRGARKCAGLATVPFPGAGYNLGRVSVLLPGAPGVVQVTVGRNLDNVYRQYVARTLRYVVRGYGRVAQSAWRASRASRAPTRLRLRSPRRIASDSAAFASSLRPARRRTSAWLIAACQRS